MKDKKSFILYCDIIKTVEKLPDDKAGLLFKHLLKYVNDEDPKTDDIIVDIAFEPIKQQLKRDLQKYEEIKQKRSEAGKLSAKLRKEKQALANSTSVESVQQTSTNSTVTVNDTVNDTVTVNDIKNNNKSITEKVFSGDVISVYDSIVNLFDNTKPKTDKDSNKWKDEIRKLIEIDGKEPKEIIELVKAVRSDDFWKTNFFSVAKLRKKNNEGICYFQVFESKFGKFDSSNDLIYWRNSFEPNTVYHQNTKEDLKRFFPNGYENNERCILYPSKPRFKNLTVIR